MKKTKTSIKLNTESDQFDIRKGVRQGDTISPKLFIACLETIFKNLGWQELKIDVTNNNIWL
jgi:hypothetical protein